METLEQLTNMVNEISKLDIKKLSLNQLNEISNQLDKILNKGIDVLLQQVQNQNNEENN